MTRTRIQRESNERESPGTMRELCLSEKFQHQKIKWNYGILRSVLSAIILKFWKNHMKESMNIDLFLIKLLNCSSRVPTTESNIGENRDCHNYFPKNWPRL